MRTSFFNTNLSGADASQATMIEVDLRNANLKGTNFSAANMNGADISRAELAGANFTKAMIRDSLWIMTDMRDANFDMASLHRCDLNMARYDETTRFPKNFDPENTGARDVVD